MLTWWYHEPLEVKIANQCAPVLAGVKPSNMLVLENKHIRDVVRVLEGTGLSWRCLYAGEEKNIWLLYRKEAMEETVLGKEQMLFLREWGYEEDTLERMLMKFSQRFRQYRKDKNLPFPHEMGVFLGYPMADVKGFIKYEGKNYLYCGYWKVYENVEERKELFRTYEEIRKVFVEEARKGKNLWQITMEWQYVSA
ncbi:MAG: DUF3793 family protein [Frisingicoccus sp.]|uniref:DUF3793 family protein n=2 Tax=Frisingicoccus sp. TaxID=1918627 RepID=UPI002A805245|nr:DUF3793 family protein [Frisingicoccus sp.]MDY4835833.1 DUF3793 family protein [Frisingicoccus sp.]MDY5956673.1 DUF3793 family protein [Frisingicoccus sp.]